MDICKCMLYKIVVFQINLDIDQQHNSSPIITQVHKCIIKVYTQPIKQSRHQYPYIFITSPPQKMKSWVRNMPNTYYIIEHAKGQLSFFSIIEQGSNCSLFLFNSNFQPPLFPDVGINFFYTILLICFKNFQIFVL